MKYIFIFIALVLQVVWLIIERLLKIIGIVLYFLWDFKIDMKQDYEDWCKVHLPFHPGYEVPRSVTFRQYFTWFIKKEGDLWEL